MLESLLQELQQTSAEQKTGVFFLVSKDKRSAQLSFLDGKPVYAMGQGKKGREAVALIAQMEIDRQRFQEGAIPPTRAEMPTFEELLRLLQEGGAGGKQESGKQSPARSGEARRQAVFSDQQKAIIQDVLAECIGPMAIILCEEHFAVSQTAEDAIERLAQELPASQIESFRTLVQRKL